MSKFPTDFDDDTTLPFINDNLNDIGGEAINALRDVAFALEQNIGLGAAGTTNSIADRFGVSINPNGTIKSSAIASLGLVTLPIRQDQIADDAQIPESKLRLDHRTQDLFNYIRDLSGDVNLAIGWISISGVKLEPHLIGAIYRHTMDQIDVSGDPIGFPFLKNKFRQFRNNLQSYNLVNDINNELLAHQWADGSNFTTGNVVTNNGSLYSANYGHTASGIFLNTSRFVNIPETADDVQLFAEFIDESSILLLGTRIQNLYSNGISRISRSSSLSIDGYGQSIVPMTPAIAYLKNIGSNSTPFDDIDRGDDIIEFKPLAAAKTSNSFDAQFALVKVGDTIRVNYGAIETSFIIKEKKYIAATQKYLVRIAGKNLFYSPIAVARIDRPLVNNNKFGVLAVAPANNQFNQIPSLIIGSPRGAQALGVGFSPDEFNETHYLLYLALYPTGSPLDGYTILPGIDVTGNRGVTPGLYTLESIVDATNAAFRQPGFNYRFIAFSYQGEFGIMLADAYNNTAFSILSAVVAADGTLDQLGSSVVFQNNVVDLFPSPPHKIAPDPLGFGPFGSGIASPPFMTTYGSTTAAQNPTRLLVPLRRNNYYVDGAEIERLNLQPGQALDGYGDGYWVGAIQEPLPVNGGRQAQVYRVAQDLSTSELKIGKTLVVQSIGAGGLIDFGRFIIYDINFGCNPANFTDITVYDAVHAQGFSPAPTLGSDGYTANVALYFNSDSVSFNAETATDFVTATPFKRHFEVYIGTSSAGGQFNNTFTHERGRMCISGSNIVIDTPTPVTLYGSTQPSKLDLIKISPKLRGYQFGPVTKINLNIASYDANSGVYDGYLSSFDGSFHTHLGPVTTGKKGEITRFYDETNIDYIDVLFDISTSIVSFTAQNIDIQLFPTLSLDDEIMMIGTCQLNDTTKFINRVRDERQFGNTSEKELSTSALNFIALPERLLHFNGIIRGFDIVDTDNEVLTLTGGQALVNGKFQSVNNEIFTIPAVRELYFSIDFPINWALCVNMVGELTIIPLTDFDSVLGTPNDPTRLVVLKNVVSNNTYTVDSTTFANLLNNRKDLTILYVISSTVDGTPIVTLTSKDVRRYVNDQDSNIPVVLTTDSAQGNFKNFISAINWIRNNNAFQNTIEVKGAQVVPTDPNLIGMSLNIVSQGAGASLSFSTSINTAGVHFRDLTLNITGSLNSSEASPSSKTPVSEYENCNVNVSSSLTVTNTIFNNCNISAFTDLTATSSTFIDCNIFIVTGTLTSIGSKFIRCTFTTIANNISVSSSAFTDCTFPVCGGTSFIGTSTTFTNCINPINLPFLMADVTLTSCNFLNCTGFVIGRNLVSTDTNFRICSNMSVGGTTTVSSSLASTPVVFLDCQVVFTGFVTSTNVTFEDCTLTFTGGGFFTNTIIDPSTITVGAPIAAVSTTILDSIITVSSVQGFAPANGFRFERNTVTWTGSPTTGYATGDLVNSGNGMIYAIIGNVGRLQDVKINNNIFNYALQDHFPFISIQVTDKTAVVENVSVSGNKFISTAASNDLRAVIAIISTLVNPPLSTDYPKFPFLINVSLDKNECNYDQMIIISSLRDQTNGYMNGSAPATIGVSISGNICGTIGYFTSSPSPFDGNNVGSPDFGIIRDKGHKLIIKDNTCKFISNLDSIGDYICFRATAFPSNNFFEEVISTIGEAAIINNTANWIQVGAGGYTVAASGVDIINNSLSPISPAFLANFSGFILQNVTPSNVGILLRREYNAASNSQSTITGNMLNQRYTSQSNGTQNTYYYDCGIVCFNNCKIADNTIAGVINASTAPIMYLWNQNVFLVTGNNLRRQGLTVQSYVTSAGTSSNSLVQIVDNIFDSPTVDGTNENTGLNIPADWKFERNRNQTGYGALNWNNIGMFSYEGSTIWNFNNGGYFGQATFDPAVNNSSVFIVGDLSLESYIPQNVQVLYIINGVFLNSATSTVGTLSEYTFRLSKKFPSSFSISSPNGSLADVKNVANVTGDAAVSLSSNTLSLTPGNAATFRAATQYMVLDTSSFGIYTGAQSIVITLSADLVSASGQFLSTPISMVLVKYRW